MALNVGTHALGSITYNDSMNKKGSFEIVAPTLTAANFDAKRALFATLVTKTNALTNGVNVSNEYGNITVFLDNLPSDTLAARQNKFLILARDNTTGQKITSTIPTADLTAVTFLSGAGDNVNLTTPAAVTEWITAFQAIAINQETGNPLTVYGIKFVGRNS